MPRARSIDKARESQTRTQLPDDGPRILERAAAHDSPKDRTDEDAILEKRVRPEKPAAALPCTGAVP